MRLIDPEAVARVPGRRLAPDEPFTFHCHPQRSCFNRCCHNLNLFLHPYDVLRLKIGLGIDSDTFLERYTDAVLRPDTHFPEVVLRMRTDADRACPFVGLQGCRVYAHRPYTCRLFPVEQGLLHDAHGRPSLVHFLRPPDFCQGPQTIRRWTAESWTADPDARRYRDMTVRWAAIRQRLATDPWQGQGPYGQRARMTFMAAYNLDGFRAFVLQSSFLTRFRVERRLAGRLADDDTALLTLGLAWVRLLLWGESGPDLQPR